MDERTDGGVEGCLDKGQRLEWMKGQMGRWMEQECEKMIEEWTTNDKCRLIKGWRSD